jgi:glycosyltransferase involved in cell wall biosynthesis
MKSISIYHSNIIHKGGIETFLFVFCKQLSKHYNITLYYSTANIDTLLNIGNYVNCRKYTGETIQADYVIFASAWGVIPKVKASKVIQMIHADLRAYADSKMFNLKPNPQATHYVSVSNQVQKSLSELHNLESHVIYNLIDTDIPVYPKNKNKVLTIVTACRLSKEKGIERCIALSKLLPFDHEWIIYGETPNTSYKQQLQSLAFNTSIKFRPFTNDPHPIFANADWVAQLSDTEGFCYTIQESLYQRTPILATPFPSISEFKNKKSIQIIDFDLKNINFESILNPPNIGKYVPNSTPNDWIKFLES